LRAVVHFHNNLRLSLVDNNFRTMMVPRPSDQAATAAASDDEATAELLIGTRLPGPSKLLWLAGNLHSFDR
jgi:hypothetical protein